MMLQNNGELYTQDENGLVTTGIDSKNAVKGLQLLGDLFTNTLLIHQYRTSLTHLDTQHYQLVL